MTNAMTTREQVKTAQFFIKLDEILNAERTQDGVFAKMDAVLRLAKRKYGGYRRDLIIHGLATCCTTVKDRATRELLMETYAMRV